MAQRPISAAICSTKLRQDRRWLWARCCPLLLGHTDFYRSHNFMAILEHFKMGEGKGIWLSSVLPFKRINAVVTVCNCRGHSQITTGLLLSEGAMITPLLDTIQAIKRYHCSSEVFWITSLTETVKGNIPTMHWLRYIGFMKELRTRIPCNSFPSLVEFMLHWRMSRVGQRMGTGKWRTSTDQMPCGS